MLYSYLVGDILPLEETQCKLFFKETFSMEKKIELTAVEAARKAGMRLDVLYPLLRVGKIPARQVNGRWLVSVAGLAEYIEHRQKRFGSLAK